MFEVITHYDFDASPQQVWEVLVDFPSYSEWNPFIIKANPAKSKESILDKNLKGQNLQITTKVMEDKPQVFNPKITEATPAKELSWVGKVGSECLLKAEHSFVLEEIKGGKTRLIHSEKFSGMLSGIINAEQRGKIRKSFEKMNSSLAERVEEVNKPTGAPGLR